MGIGDDDAEDLPQLCRGGKALDGVLQQFDGFIETFHRVIGIGQIVIAAEIVRLHLNEGGIHPDRGIVHFQLVGQAADAEDHFRVVRVQLQQTLEGEDGFRGAIDLRQRIGQKQQGLVIGRIADMGFEIAFGRPFQIVLLDAFRALEKEFLGLVAIGGGGLRLLIRTDEIFRGLKQAIAEALFPALGRQCFGA